MFKLLMKTFHAEIIFYNFFSESGYVVDVSTDGGLWVLLATTYTVKESML